MANNILTIGDDKSENNPKTIPGKHYEWNFEKDFREHLIKLMLTGTAPLQEPYDKDLIEHFSAQRKDRNGKTFYQFACGAENPARHEFGYTIISGPTCNGNAELNLVRERLKEMNWISNNVVECQRTHEKEYSYMHGIITDCMNIEEFKLYNYILCLQQQFRNHS